jgi:chromosome partitioning protein
MHDGSATLTHEVVADIEAYFEQARGKALPWSGAQVFKPPIRRNIKLAECPSFGKSIFEYAPTAPGAADYKALAESVLGSKAVEASATASPAPTDPASIPAPQVIVPRSAPLEAAG